MKVIKHNKLGYIIGFLSAIIYTIYKNGFRFDELLYFISGLLGALILPVIIAFIITSLKKDFKFGKVFGITCLILYTLSTIGSTY